MPTVDHDFSEDIKINKYRLEEECEKQASTYLFWAKQCADAKSELNEAEDALKLVTSQTDLKHRKFWDEAKFGKSTENSIKAAIETNDSVVAAKGRVAELQRKVNTLSAAVSAFEHRKDELKNLTGLLIGGFYSAPNGGRRETGEKVIQREVRDKLKKRKEV